MRVCWPVHSWRLSISRGQWTTLRHCAATTALFQRSGVNNLLRENRSVDFTTQKSTSKTFHTKKKQIPFFLSILTFTSHPALFSHRFHFLFQSLSPLAARVKFKTHTTFNPEKNYGLRSVWRYKLILGAAGLILASRNAESIGKHSP